MAVHYITMGGVEGSDDAAIHDSLDAAVQWLVDAQDDGECSRVIWVDIDDEGKREMLCGDATDDAREKMFERLGKWVHPLIRKMVEDER